MKKVLAAALLCAVSSFATWDYFPIKPAGKGEVKAAYGYIINYEGVEKQNASGLNAGARFSVIEGLEIATMWNFPMTASYDGDACEPSDDCPPTMDQPTVGVRYWLPMGVGIALDVSLPFKGDAMGGSDATNLVFSPAVQYSNKLTDELELGSQVGISIPLENGDTKVKPGMDLGIGVELDYSLGMAVPYIGVDVDLGLTKPQYDGKDAGDAAKAGIDLNIGSNFNINEMFTAGVGATLGLGEGRTGGSGGKMPITIQASVSLNF